MKHFSLLSSLLLLPLTLSLTTGAAAQSDFTIIVLPDMQNATQLYPQVVAAQTQWIAQHKTDMNIQAVLGEGDIVNDGADNAQWANADAAFRLLDGAQIPYFLAIGNHDYDGANAGVNTRSAKGFNQWFGAARYAATTWYLGNYNGGSENSYGVINVNGANLLVLVLEFVPRDAVVNWAAAVLQANPDKAALVVTHSYMYTDNTRIDQCDTADLNSQNYGDKLWSKLLGQNANVQMVFSGHITNGQGSRRADLAVQRNLVNQMFANYQTLPNGGNGYLRILTFHPLTNTVDVKTYSPFVNAYKTDAASQFTIFWRVPLAAAASGAISGSVRSSAGCKPIPGAMVTAGSIVTTADSNGRYSLAMPAGSFAVAAGANGYASASQSVVVNNGYASDTNFFLAAQPCALNPASPSVTICTPANNATVTSPVQVTAGTTDSNKVSFVQLYVDGIGKVPQNGGTLSTSVPLTSGSHRLTALAKDSTGATFKQSVYVTVSAPPAACTAGSVSPSVTICAPAANAVVTSPVRVVAATTSPLPVATMEVYVDGVKVTQKAGRSIDTSIAIAKGTHRLTVLAVDNTLVTFKQSVSITVQ